jgi:hypothetical protein
MKMRVQGIARGAARNPVQTCHFGASHTGRISLRAIGGNGIPQVSWGGIAQFFEFKEDILRSSRDHVNRIGNFLLAWKQTFIVN